MTTLDPWDYWDYQGVGGDRLTNYAAGDGLPVEAVKALLTPFRDLERLHHDLLDMLSIERATGQGLDAFGEMVKINRLGRDDETYRAAIKNKRFASGGSGTWPEVKNVLKTIIGGRNRKVDHFPAAYVVVLTESDNVTIDVKSRLDDIGVAGVAAYPVFDYGIGGFELSGISGNASDAMGVAPGSDLALGLKPGTDVAMGAGGARVIPLGGTPLASTRERDSSAVDLGSRTAGAYYWGSF